MPNLSGLALPTGETLPQRLAREARERASEGVKNAKTMLGNTVDKTKLSAYNTFKSHFKIPKKVPIRDALLQVAKALHTKLLELKFTKRTWEDAEAQLMKVKLMARVGASLGDTVLPTGNQCDDPDYADKHPDDCESVAEAMIWNVIWCFFLYLIGTDDNMNTVGCAGVV